MPVGKTVHDLEREYYLSQLGLSVSQAANMTLTDLRVAFYTNPPAGGGGGGLDLTNSTGTLNADKIVAGSTNAPMTVVEKSKLTGIATGATANSSDATLLARANHTGTMSADSITDGTTNKAFLATERTKLTGVATGATVNSADATLLARANHTGTQASTTVVDFVEASQDVVGALLADSPSFDATYNDAAGTWSVAVAGGGAYVAEWNAGAWAVRPATSARVIYISTTDAAATVPTDAVTGDVWFRHPDALENL